MSEISFYHLQSESVAQALPKLVERALGAGLNMVVRFSNSAQLNEIDKALWTYDAASFLPHGTNKSGDAGDQPIYLSLSTDNPNGSNAVFIIDQAPFDDLEGYERCFYMFDGKSEPLIAHARAQWKQLKRAGFDLKYWQQSNAGKWEEKAVS
jgi:DNA polymerase III subunit chi